MSYYEKGRYLGEILSHGLGVSKVKKTEQCKLVFRVVAVMEGDDYVELEDDCKFERDVTVYFKAKSAKRAIDSLKKYAGWDGDVDGLNNGALEGKQIEVVCTGENDSGYDEFAFPGQPGGAAKPATQDKAVASTLKNKFADLLGGNRPEKPGGRKQRPKANKPLPPKTDGNGPQEEADDLIPF